MMWRFTYTQTPKHQYGVWLGVVLLHVVMFSTLLHSSPQADTRLEQNSMPLEMVMTPATQKAFRVAEPSRTQAMGSRTPAATSPLLTSPSTSQPTTSTNTSTHNASATAQLATTEASSTRASPSAASQSNTASSLPNAQALGLNNPAPSYPKLSRRLNEQGQVVIRVYVGADGSARQGEIKTSSGYDRLDQEALRTVMRWRFVPGQHLGVPEAMWFNVPVNFVLD
jgi:protein TonB